jgi:hypothetical protein|tara:strand:- start:2949 stop:3317 length:369 start_codon:yes stop_codon:yes gene_type:complete
MATNSQWTIVFEDKIVLKQTGDAAGTGYVINDDSFWSQSKFSNIWAIQYGTANPNDTVEYKDETPHSTWEDANLGDFQDFITRWDTHHLSVLQSDWDGSNQEGESEADKIARLGSRPTSYSS